MAHVILPNHIYGTFHLLDAEGDRLNLGDLIEFEPHSCMHEAATDIVTWSGFLWLYGPEPIIARMPIAALHPLDRYFDCALHVRTWLYYSNGEVGRLANHRRGLPR